MDLTTFTLIITPWAQLQFSTDVDRGDDLLRKGQASQLTTDAESTTPYWFSAHSMQLLPCRRNPNGQEHLNARPAAAVFTITGSTQLQLSGEVEPGSDALRSGHMPHLTDPSSPVPYRFAAQSEHDAPFATDPTGHTHALLESPGSKGVKLSKHTHSASLDAPVPLVVRPDGHGLQVA